MSDKHPFNRLQPDFICDAIDHTGLMCDLRLMALNSFENRVYQVGIEDQQPLIAKFYRPDRWSRQQILEEHTYSAELASAELDVIAPLALDNGDTLFEYKGFFIALFKRFGGQPPALEDEGMSAVLGRLLGRMHAIARSDRFDHRPGISVQEYAVDSSELILRDWIPSDLRASYESLLADVLPLLHSFEEAQSKMELRPLRSHGDFHLGNMIHRDERVYMLDLDDTRTALAIQDIWMLLSGEEHEQQAQLDDLLRHYEEFHDFDWREIHFVEYFRTLRILQHSAWIARRWDDPAFPLAFPWFEGGAYWANHILALREQLYKLQQNLSALRGPQ